MPTLTASRPTIKANERAEILEALRTDAGAEAIVTWEGVLEITGDAQAVHDAAAIVRASTTWSPLYFSVAAGRPVLAKFNALT